PDIFARVHPRFRTPHISTMLTGSVVALGAGLLPLHLLSQLVSMGTLLAFVLVCIGIILLRRTSPELPRPFRTPGMPWVPIAGALACLIQMFGLPWATWERLIIWLVAGLIIYFAYGQKRAAARRAERARAAPIAA